jgi:hypothetical protein
MKEAGLKFSTESEGSGSSYLQGSFKFEDGRTQQFFLKKEADEWGGHSENDLTAVIGPAADSANVKKACEMADKMKRGGVIVDNSDLICLKVEISTDVTGETAYNQVMMTCVMADDMEKEIFGGDDW